MAERLSTVRGAIAEACLVAGRPLSSVRLVAVTKGHPASAIAAAAAAGQRAFGENYAKELRDKRRELGALGDTLEWHFIGRVQGSNAREIAGAALVHGVGSREQAAALAARAKHPLDVLLQVSLWGEQSKNGFSEAELRAELDALRRFEELRVRGLMAMPPPSLGGAEASRAAFRAVRLLRDRLCPDLPELSMGMSDDFREAIAEGATLVRVGSAIFGERMRKAG
ncbi:MAG: YggS family pyridoxal phosphate-dependent enzyme [Deltaproteobacteria bacterium]|nr:YggS family pyridoxal phosphate-dependent enzyme [Deltaproteobacteria bacterium]